MLITIRNFLLFIFFTCALTVSAANLSVPARDQYQMKGYCKINHTWMVSISNLTNGGRYWLRPGQGIGDLRLEQFDSENKTAILSVGTDTFKLQLMKNDDSPLPVVQSNFSSSLKMIDIDQKVSEYESGLAKILMAPAAGPRSPEDEAGLKQDLSRMVANYREKLISEQTAPLEAVLAHPAPESKTSSVIAVKRRNKINSRIWASDHIEVHGAPAGAEYLERAKTE